MAQLGNLLVKGSSRFLNKAYFEDISIAGTSFFSGNISTDGTLNIGANKASNALLYLNNKIAVRAVDSWLRINDTSTNFTSGVYFGNSDVRTDKEFQVGDGGKYFKINSSSLNVNVSSVFSQRTTHNGGLISPTISSNLISFVKNGNTLPKIDGADATAVLNELTVLSTLRAKEYELDHVQNLGGTFMVSPSFICTEGNTSVTVSAISGSEVTFLIKDNATLTKTEIATASWVLNSQIKLSGKIGNTILANATGTITKSVDTNNHTITVKVDVGSSTVGNFTVNTTYSGSQVSKLALMMIRNASGYRLGIYLESYSSENKKPVINIFDGSDTNPKVVLGKLDGTPKINNISPTGYGLYSDNAFLKGTIIATSGTIGGFTLSTNSIQNGTFGQDGSVMMSLGSNNSASIGDSGNINGWTFTAGSKFGVTKNGAMYATSGKIGGFNIDSTYLQSSDKTVGLSASASDWAFWAGGAGTDTAKFRVNHAGKLWASNATIAGNITATSGKIGKYNITNNYLISGSGSTCTGMGGNQAFWAGSNDSSIAPFHVSYDGSLYASKANISGIINSTDGSIGGWKISSNKLSAFKNGIHHDSSTGEDYDAEYYISLLSGKDEIPTIITSYEYYPPDEDWKYETIISPTEITCKESYAPPDSSGMGVCNSTVYSSNGITFYNGVKIDGLTKVLWEGADYMNGTQTALLDEKVSDQLNGIALVWSHYNISTHQASNSDVHVQFISKWCVGEMNGAGHAFIDPYRRIDKYFYVYNDKIVGSNINGTSGTEGGISYDNRNCVLRAVLGV
nr:MAG TPA: hypothetical protein [Caudoviricetes sp.]